MAASQEADQRIADLLWSLRNLAADAPVQVKHLARLGLQNSADELALELYDSVVLLGQLVDDGAMSEEQAEAVLVVDRKLKSISGEKNSWLWTPEALKQNDIWSEIRRLASRALAALGDPSAR